MQSCSEVAKIEGITRARVSQLWPLSRISKEQAEQSLRERSRREISLRALIRFARNTGVKLADSGGGDGLEGNKMATVEPHRLSQYGTSYLVSFSYPEETNFVLNLRHPDFRRIRVSTAEPF